MDNERIPDRELILDLQKFQKKYVVLDDHQSFVLAHWIIHTWNMGAAYVTPYIRIFSYEPSSGKTTLLETLQTVTRNAKRADDMTAPVMFKIIHREMPTLLIDEIDTVWSGSRNEPKRQVLNTGYRRGGVAWREQARQPVEFQTFGAKALCGIENGFMPATIADRCIPIELKRKKVEQKTERFVMHRVVGSVELENLLDRIEAFSNDFFADITAQSPRPMTNLSPRQDEISEPLLAIASVLGTDTELRKSLEHIFANAGKTRPNPTQIIFQRIFDAFDGQERIHTEDLCKALGPMYNGRMLAIWLEPFGIAPRDIRIGNQVRKGYTADQFESAWKTHLGLKQEQEFEEDEEEIA